jgi:hypothetical protein
VDASNCYGLLSQACAEIRDAEGIHHSRKAQRRLLRQPIEVIDGLINNLEELNLKGISRVPLSYEPRLLQLRAMLAGSGLSAEQLDGLRARVRIGRLMDSLYSVQEVLFAQTRPDIPREPDASQRPAVVAVEETAIADLEEALAARFFSAA